MRSRCRHHDINRGMLLTFRDHPPAPCRPRVNQSIRVLDSADQVRALSYGRRAASRDCSRRLEVAIPAFAMIVGSMLLGMVVHVADACGGCGKGLPLRSPGDVGVVLIVALPPEATVPLHCHLASVRE